MRRTTALLGVVVALSGGTSGRAASEEELLEDPAVAEIERELRRLASPWQTSLETAVRGGWRDNVLFSSFEPEASAFVGASAEGMVTRTLGEASSVEMFGSVDYRHYLEATQTDHELVAFGVLGWRTSLGAGWSLRTGVEYVYQDQQLDVSANEVDLSVTNVLGHSLTLRPVLRRALGRATWIELEPRAQRSLYNPPLDDVWEGGGAVTVGWKPNARSELSLSGSYDHRWYDTEPERTVTGDPVPGTTRESDIWDVRARWRQTWDEQARWRTTARIGGRLLRDGAAGYYDYNRLTADCLIRYHAARWRAEVGPRVAVYDYLQQTTSDTDLSARRRCEVGLTTSLQWTVYRRAALFLEYAWEQTLSSRPEDEYGVNTLGGGVRLEY